MHHLSLHSHWLLNAHSHRLLNSHAHRLLNTHSHRLLNTHANRHSSNCWLSSLVRVVRSFDVDLPSRLSLMSNLMPHIAAAIISKLWANNSYATDLNFRKCKSYLRVRSHSFVKDTEVNHIIWARDVEVEVLTKVKPDFLLTWFHFGSLPPPVLAWVLKTCASSVILTNGAIVPNISTSRVSFASITSILIMPIPVYAIPWIPGCIIWLFILITNLFNIKWQQQNKA